MIPYTPEVLPTYTTTKADDYCVVSEKEIFGLLQQPQTLFPHLYVLLPRRNKLRQFIMEM